MKFEITVTASKMLAFLVVIVGAIYTFITKEANVLITSFSVGCLLMGVKTGANALVDVKNKS